MNKTFSSIRVHFLVVLSTALFMAVNPVWAGGTASTCEALTSLELPNTTLTDAQIVLAGDFKAPDNNTYTVPAFCRVQGIAKPSNDSLIHFEIWLPVEKWNGRYHQYAQGGSGGAISYGGLADFLNTGAVGGATDDGHDNSWADRSRWALGHPEKIIDLGYRALKETSDHARAIIQAYYGKKPQYTYISGCSDGGRGALLAAQRFPDEWDGILAGSPGNYRVPFSLALNAWVGQLWLNNPEGRIPQEKLPAIQRTALASCTDQAKVVEGIAADPRFCRYDPEVLACQGVETDQCLTAAQVDTLRELYEGPRDSVTGERLYPAGLIPTGEGNWAGEVTGKEDKAPLWLGWAESYYRNFVFDNPEWTFSTLDLDRDFKKGVNKNVAGQTLATVMNADNPDLSRIKNNGGKILSYFGWEEPLPPEAGIHYYQEVVNHIGGFKKAHDFYRLFPAPGMLHCMNGKGANAFGQLFATPGLKNDAEHNILRALEAWVEQGIAPDKIIAAKYINNKPEEGVAMTRPLCPYPQVVTYKGTGSTAKAENFSCVEGTMP